MGFLDFLKKEEPVQETSIGLEDIDIFLSRHENAVSRDREEAGNLAKNIEFCFGNIRSKLKELEGLEFLSHDKRTASAVNMAKNTFMRQTASLLSSAPERPNTDIDAINDFVLQSKKILASVKEIQPKHALVLTRYFPNWMKVFVSDVKSAEDAISKQERLISNSSRITLYSEADGLKGRISDDISLMQRLKKEINDLNGAQRKYQEALKLAEKDLESLEKDKEVKECDELKGEIESLEKEIAYLKSAVDEAFSKVERPAKKYSHTTKKQIDFIFQRNSRGSIPILKDMLAEAEGLGFKATEERSIKDLINKCEVEIPRTLDKIEVLNSLITEKRENMAKMSILAAIREKSKTIEDNKNIILGIEEQAAGKKSLIKPIETGIGEKVRKLEDILSRLSSQKVSINTKNIA